MKRVGGGYAPKDGSGTTRSRDAMYRTGMQIMENAPKNNLIGNASTIDYLHRNGDNQSDYSDKLKYLTRQTERERKLSHIANSVSGFYKEPEQQSEHSMMKSTYSQNIA